VDPVRLRDLDRGAVTVAVYETSSADQVAWILADSGAVAAFVENERYADLIRRGQATSVRHVWAMDSGDLDDLAVSGRSIPREQVERRGIAAGVVRTCLLGCGLWTAGIRDLRP